MRHADLTSQQTSTKRNTLSPVDFLVLPTGSVSLSDFVASQLPPQEVPTSDREHQPNYNAIPKGLTPQQRPIPSTHQPTEPLQATRNPKSSETTDGDALKRNLSYVLAQRQPVRRISANIPKALSPGVTGVEPRDHYQAMKAPKTSYLPPEGAYSDAYASIKSKQAAPPHGDTSSAMRKNTGNISPPPSLNSATDLMTRKASPTQLRAKSNSPTPDAFNFQKSVEELISSEKEYGKNLTVLKDIFATPLSKSGLPESDYGVAFGTFEPIIELNKNLLADWERAGGANAGPEILSSIFLKMVPLFKKHYHNFCLDHSKIVTLLDKWRGGNSSIQQILTNGEKSSEAKGLSLPAFLIMPVQRMCRYPLLLDAILKNFNKDEVERSTTNELKQALVGILSDINVSRKGAEDKEKLLEIQDNIEGPRPTIASSSRTIIRMGEIKLEGEVNAVFQIVLCNDVLLLCRRKPNKKVQRMKSF